MLHIGEMSMEERIERFCRALEALAGKTYVAGSKDAARDYAANLLNGRTAVASGHKFLAECGITSLPGVAAGNEDRAELRRLCSTVDVGITSAEYALADTGTLVMLASPENARLVSLLPPAHLAIIPREILLTGLEELFTRIPSPMDLTSAMVLITGPSRTADIEQILVRGVHGPGEIHAVIV
jgi:L-lactate utilization protein LutC